MRPQDKVIFGAAAANPGIKSWILVRRTNPKSLKYIGMAGYSPKRLDCKAKTADDGPFAGLVVSPVASSKSFGPSKLEKAMKYWKIFETEVMNGPNSDYKVAEDGRVTCLGSYIHGDYDLYDIIDPAQAQRNLAAVETMLGQPHRRGPKFYAVQEFVNSRIGVPMVQHGGEAQYADHSQQAIDAFGPNHEEVTILNEFSVRAWYRDRFGGRKTLG